MSRRLTHILAAVVVTSGLFAGIAATSLSSSHGTRQAVVCCAKG
jgi:hypothetical protein